jgi:hypothetical protein
MAETENFSVEGSCIGLFSEGSKKPYSVIHPNSKGEFKLNAPDGKYRLVVKDGYGLYGAANVPITVDKTSAERRKILVSMRPPLIDSSSYGNFENVFYSIESPKPKKNEVTSAEGKNLEPKARFEEKKSRDLPTVNYCDVLKNPTEFEGKKLMLKATYRYGVEWQEMFCLTCRDKGRTWLEIEDDAISSQSKKALRKFPESDGTINAIFTGRFESSGGPFGDGSYRFRFVLEDITNAELISSSGFEPASLPGNVLKKICDWSKTDEQGQPMTDHAEGPCSLPSESKNKDIDPRIHENTPTRYIHLLGDSDAQRRREAVLEIYAYGKKAIPDLIEAISSDQEVPFLLANPINSNLSGSQTRVSLGLTAAYLVELILSKKDFAIQSDDEKEFIFGNYKNYVYSRGEIFHTADNKVIAESDLALVKIQYQTWWSKNADKSLETLREDWAQNKKPLTETLYKWK